MQKIRLTSALILIVYSTAYSQIVPSGPDTRKFEITPAQPVEPALKYHLLYDRRLEPGNAAILYLDAILLMDSDAPAKADEALAAFKAGDYKSFDSIADSLQMPDLFKELDLAARREECDWDPPSREVAGQTLLPHLAPLLGVAKVIKVRALRQIQLGKTANALSTLRLGYALADKMGREPMKISGLVSLRIMEMMNNGLALVMNQPDAPNLYWPLACIPQRRPIFRVDIDGARNSGSAYPSPALAREADQDLSPDQWRSKLGEDALQNVNPPIKQLAEQQYAESHQLSAEALSKVDLAVVLGNYYFDEYEMFSDEIAKLRELPYPVLLIKSVDFDNLKTRLNREQPLKPFIMKGPIDLHRIAWRYAYTDRQIAGLTLVAAINCFAATHDHDLPQRLADISDVPIPNNPASGMPFDYQLQKDVGILSDSHSDESLRYAIEIRK